MPEFVAIAYFPDDETRVYQLAQWLPVLEVLDRVHRVGRRTARSQSFCGVRLPNLFGRLA